MKKIFSAFLLMTMMVASVGSFVSCSDIEESIAAVDEATKDNAASIKDLEGKIAALQTALQTAQSEAAAAKAEANAAKQAAATAKAEAIAAALAEIEKVNGDVDAVNAEIKKINDALAGCATKEAVELLQATIDEYKALIDANGDATTANAEAIAAIEEALAAIGENVTPEQLAEVVAKMTAIDQALVAFQNRLQSVSYVPEWVEGPTAVLFAENEEYGYVHMSYEVAPAAYASKITAENTKLVGVALKETKSVEVEEYDVKILSADSETGIVEVIAYIGVDSEVWTKGNAAVALRVVAEDAQFTSAYTNVDVLGGNKTAESISKYVFFGTYNEDGEFTTGNITHEVAYDTAVADSEVALFEGLVARVNVPGFFEDLTVEEAAEMFGIEIEVTEKLSSYATKYFVTTNAKAYDLVEDAKKEKDTPAFVVTNDQSLDITVKFNETVVNYLKDNDDEKDLTDLVKKTAKVELKEGFFQVNGKKSATFEGMTATYKVVGLEQTIELIVDDVMVEWTPENAKELAADKYITIKDLNVSGGDARDLESKVLSKVDWKVESLDEDVVAPEIDVDFISVDNADVKVYVTSWPEKETTYNYTVTGTYSAEAETTVIVTFDLAVTVGTAPEAIGDVPVADEILTVTLQPAAVDEDDQKDTDVTIASVVDALLPYYKEYFKKESDAKAAIDAAANEVAITLVNDNGELTETVVTGATYTYTAKTATKAEVSKITIPYEIYGSISKPNANQYVQFSIPVTILGIESAVVVDAKITPWSTFSAAPQVLPGRLSPEFKGVKTFTVTEAAPVIVYVDPKAEVKVVDYTYTYFNTPVNNGVYAYNATTFNFTDYVTIKIADDDPNKANYQVRWKVADMPGITYTTKVTGTGAAATTEYIAHNGNLPRYTDTQNAAGHDSFVLNANYDPKAEAGENSYLNTVRGNDTDKGYWGQTSIDRFYEWGLDWNGSNVNTYTIVIELVLENTDAATKVETPWIVIDDMNLTFTTPSTISDVVTENVEVEWAEYDKTVQNPVNPMVANALNGVKVYDLFNEAPINNMAERTLTTFWDSYEIDHTNTQKQNKVEVNNEVLTPIYTRKGSQTPVYGQSIEFVAFDHDSNSKTEKVMITNDGGFTGDIVNDVYTSEHFTFDFTTGEFAFVGNTKPANDVTFTVCVAVSHMNDNGNPIEKTVNIVLKK